MLVMEFYHAFVVDFSSRWEYKSMSLIKVSAFDTGLQGAVPVLDWVLMLQIWNQFIFSLVLAQVQVICTLNE